MEGAYCWRRAPEEGWSHHAVRGQLQGHLGSDVVLKLLEKNKMMDSLKQSPRLTGQKYKRVGRLQAVQVTDRTLVEFPKILEHHPVCAPCPLTLLSLEQCRSQLSWLSKKQIKPEVNLNVPTRSPNTRSFWIKADFFFPRCLPLITWRSQRLILCLTGAGPAANGDRLDETSSTWAGLKDAAKCGWWAFGVKKIKWNYAENLRRSMTGCFWKTRPPLRGTFLCSQQVLTGGN